MEYGCAIPENKNISFVKRGLENTEAYFVGTEGLQRLVDYLIYKEPDDMLGLTTLASIRLRHRC